MSVSVMYVLENYLGILLCLGLTVFDRARFFFTPARREKKTINRIVFVKFIEQGALVLHRTTFEQATRQYGIENIFICTFSSNSSLIKELGVFNSSNCIYIDEESIGQFISSFLKSLVRIRKLNIDSTIDLEFFSRATAVFCYLCGAKNRAGFHRFKGLQNYRGNLFTHRLNYSHYLPVGESSHALLKSFEVSVEVLPALDITTPKSTAQAFRFKPNEEDFIRLSELTDKLDYEQKKIIIINPNFNDPLPLRQWHSDNYSTFVNSICGQYANTTFVFTGRQDEYDFTEKFLITLPTKNTLNLCGKTELRDLLTLYSIAHLLLTSDSGPAHFATLTSIATIVLFGPETPVLYGPVGENVHVFYKSLSCSPCYNVYNNRLSSCNNNLCMKSISPEDVVDKAKTVLAY